MITLTRKCFAAETLELLPLVARGTVGILGVPAAAHVAEALKREQERYLKKYWIEESTALLIQGFQEIAIVDLAVSTLIDRLSLCFLVSLCRQSNYKPSQFLRLINVLGLTASDFVRLETETVYCRYAQLSLCLDQRSALRAAPTRTARWGRTTGPSAAASPTSSATHCR